MGSALPAAAALEADPDGDDPARADEARVIVESSRAAKQERKEISGMLARLAAFCREQLTSRAAQVGRTLAQLAGWKPDPPARAADPEPYNKYVTYLTYLIRGRDNDEGEWEVGGVSGAL